MTKRWQEVRSPRMEDPAAQAGYKRAERAYHLAEQVRQLRSMSGLTQKQLAERMGTTQSAVARLEGGGVYPTIETLEKVAEALGAEMEISLRPRRRVRKVAEVRDVRPTGQAKSASGMGEVSAL